METSDSTATAAGKPMELMMLFDFWFTLDSVCHVLGPKKKILSCKSHDLSGLLTKVNLFLFFFYHPNLTHPPTPPVFAHLFLCTFYTTSCSQSCLFSYSPHSSPSLCFPPPLCRVPTCDFFLSRSSFSLLLYLFTSSPSLPPPPSLPLPLRFSGRLLIAVSQYHGGRQRGCRSGGECSTGFTGSHSHIQP